MNVLDILKKLDYNVLSFNIETGKYYVEFNKKRKKKIYDSLENSSMSLEEKTKFVSDKYNLEVAKAEFNELGNLVVYFEEGGQSVDVFDAGDF